MFRPFWGANSLTLKYLAEVARLIALMPYFVGGVNLCKNTPCNFHKLIAPKIHAHNKGKFGIALFKGGGGIEGYLDVFGVSSCQISGQHSTS